MTKRIIVYVLTAILLLVCFTIVLTIQATTNVIGKRQETQSYELLKIVYGIYNDFGPEYADNFSTENYKIAIFPAETENFFSVMDDEWGSESDRSLAEEFFERIKAEPGRIESISTSFLFGSVIMSGVCTEDGNVIVVSTLLSTFSNTLNEIRMELVYIILVSILLATFLARLISYLVVQPLNEIDIEAPTKEEETRYKEIMPLLNKITEQKANIAEQEKKLSDGEGRFNAISETIVEGMLLIEADHTLSYVNRAARNMITLASDPVGKDYREVFSDEMRQIVDTTFESGNQTTILYFNNRAYQMETTRIVFPGGDYGGIAILIYDITERMALEQDRRDFTANVSHELKTPLHIISGSAELLTLGIVQSEEDKKNFLRQIITETEHMTKLVNDILKLSKFDANKKRSVEKEIIPVRENALSVIERLKQVAAEKDIEILLKGDDISVKCNDIMFDQILFNLVDNAVKYTNNGGKVEVILKKAEDGSEIIDVKDNGIGIPEDSLDKVFERFYRVDKSRSREMGGTGLGLPIVKNACIENDADIKIESSILGVGTTFRVTFPPVDAEDEN